MKATLRILLTLFTILCSTTISGASIQESQEGVVFEKVCVLEGNIGFWAKFNAPKSTGFQTGVNITPRSVANNYRTIGRGGRTFVTEQSAVESVLGPLKGSRMSITGQQARQLENALGLNPSSLEARNILSIVDNVSGRVPKIPTSGNSLFQGTGAGLPGGGAELTIQGIPSAGGQGIRQIILEVIK